MKKVFLFLTMLLLAFTGTMKAESLTVHDGTTTNGNVPVYGFYADAYNKSEMVYPAAELSEMAGGTINSLTFYASQENVDWGTASFQVFVDEVADATISAFAGPGTVVYEGSLSISGGEMVVTFDTPYAYAGGNLLVGVYETSTGSYITSYWYGESVTGASGSGYSYSSLDGCTFGQKNFLPKVTFDYTVGGGTIVEADLTVYDGEATNSYVPVYGFYADAYLKCEMVYPAEVLADMNGGAINSLKFYAEQASVDWGAEFEVFVNEVADASISSFVGDGTIVYHSGALSIVGGEMVVNFETPYTYNGGNLLVGVYETTTGAYITSSWYGQSVTGASVQGYDYSSLSGVTPTQRNFLPKTTFHYTKEEAPLEPGFHVIPAEIGYRPIDAWMEPATVELAYKGEPVTVNGFDTENGNFTVNAEVPFTLNGTTQTKAIEMEINATTPGLVEDNVVVLYTNNRNMAMVPVSGIAYEPEDGDVVETAIELNPASLPFSFSGKPAGTMYHNYNLLNAEEGAVDAVYQMTFNEDVLFTANTPDGVVYLYEEGFQGEPGPKDFNYYYNEISGLGGNNSFTEDFEGGLDGWMAIDNDNDGNNWEHSSNSATVSCYTYTGYGHNASDGFALSQSYTDCTYASYDADNYLIKAEKYEIVNGSTLSFWYDYANDTYPDYFEVVVSTTGTDASDFTAVWNSYNAKNGGNDKIRHNGTRFNNWRSIDVDLSAYAGETVWIGFHHQDYDMYELWIDDVELTVGSTEGVVYNQMLVPAGTYYVAYSGTNDVNIQVVAKPVPAEVTYIRPFDGQTGYETSWAAQWQLDVFTTEMQVLFGTVYPPTVLVDWTDNLVSTMTLPGLQNNKTYFLQVNQRNENGTTYGQIIGFTTEIDGVEGFTVETEELYPGDAAVFSWTANGRNLQGYNLYQDGVKVNGAPINGTTYSVEGLEYNMTPGYNFTLTAVYAEGESAPTEPINVRMTGKGFVNGHVWEIDSITPVYNVVVEAVGFDEHGNLQVLPVGTTNPSGYYEGEILAGNWVTVGNKEGYNPDLSFSEEFELAFEATANDKEIYMVEDWAALGMIKATEEENDVLVEWSWDPASLVVDFETGDFSQAEFTLPASYPWAVTTVNPHEGTYCMKSTCEGIASGTSSIEATVEVPYDGKMGFWVKVSSESNYDKFHFYIDGVEQGTALSGNVNYTYKEYDVAEGTHTYKWEYAKDSSVNSNDDCVYVDDITMYRQDVPVPPTPGAQVFDFEDSTLQGWTTIDADGDGYNWMVASDLMSTGYGHNGSTDCVLSQSYSNSYGVLYPDNYLVSPTKIAAQNGASISFYACAQDASYAAEHFGVAVSTGSATAADFTMVQEWTMTAKGAQGNTADNAKTIRGTRAQGTWYQYTVDLSSYAGQEIWVALRHFNCNDMFYLDVDDITLNDGAAKRAEGNRTFSNFKLYRRNINGYEDPEEAPVELIASPASDVFSYTDNAWNNLDYGMYQWGIQAKYEGNHHYAEKGDRDSYEVQIGEGTSTTGYFPFYTLYNYSISENLFLASELQEAGVGTGNMTSLSWYATNTTGYAQQGISIWMANVSDTELTTTSHVVTGMTLVYTGSMTPLVGWNEFEFNEGSFAWDGTSNILIFVQRNNGDWNSTISWQASTVGFNAMAYKYQDSGAFDVTVANTMYTSTTRPNIIMKGNAGGGGGGGTTGFGDSDILWSNVIEKDMYSQVTFNLALNNAQSVAGIEMALAGVDFAEEYTFDETGTMTLELRKGEYIVAIAPEGYNPVLDELIIDQDEMSFSYTLIEEINPISDLYVSPTGFAVWGEFGGGPTPPTPPTPGTTTFTEGFEGGLNGWNVLTVNADGGEWIYSDDNLGGYDYTELAHTGTGFAMCYSFVDYVGAFDTDSYLYTPQKYSIVDGSTLTFWADNANDGYPENFSVCVATADNPTAADFTQVWSGGAKGTGNGGAAMRHQNNRYENWRSHSIDLSAYAGQEVYIAFHDVNYDAYEIWIDDVELSVVNKGNRAPISYIVKIDGVVEGNTHDLFFQHNVEGFEEGSEHTTEVLPVYASGTPEDWASYTWTYVSCSNYAGVTDYEVTAATTEEGPVVNLSWTLPEVGPTPPPTPGEGQWYYYDNGTNVDAIGTGGGNFWWGVMFPAGSYEGNAVTKVAAYDYMAMTGDVTIYNDGATAPTGSAVGTMSVTMTGSEDFVEYEFATPVTIDPSKNVWVIFYNGSGATYPAAVCANTGDANGRWVSLDGTTWEDLAGYGLDNTFMVRAYIATAKGEVVEVSVPTQNAGNGTLANAGVAKVKRSNRNMWDLLGTFEAAEGGHYGVVTDDEYIYTSNWGYSGCAHNFYKYAMDGTMIEGFEVSGCGTLRGMTFDGEYVYGVANSSTVYCVDLKNHTLVSTFTSAYGAMRAISYDPERDGFWVVGNWSGNLTLIDRTGAIVQAGPAPTSASDVAYYKDPDGVEHVFCFNNGTNDVDEYNITTGTFTSAVFNFNSTPGYDSGSSGGCHVATYQGKTAFFGDIQQSPNLIGIYELDEEVGPTPPPTPTGDILGVMIYRDGELIATVDAPATTYVDANVDWDTEYTYCIVVVYSDYAISCEQCEEVTTPVNPEAIAENEVVNSIYPNPTSGDLHINAEAMTHVTVFNAMGQMVYDQDVNADSMILNMAQYEAGVYMVRIDTENGSNVKRITVVK